MSTEEIKQRIEKIKQVSELAHREICDLASGKRKWEMCVPPQWTDSDMRLQAALDEITWLCDSLAAAVECLEQIEKIDTNDPAFSDRRGRHDGSSLQIGLTKREYFAGLAMQALIPIYNGKVKELPNSSGAAVEYADALIEALNSKEHP